MQGQQPDISKIPFDLNICQQPVHSRMCGIGERVDRRPIDPPPVVEIKLKSNNKDNIETLSLLSSYLFLIAVLVPVDGREDQNQLDFLVHSKLTVGRTVSSLYILRDLDGNDGAFFVFSDISVRAEGNYRLRMCLFNIEESTVNYNTSVLTEPFTVYSAKTFPGMYRSCPLVQNFAKQGLKIRIRKESGPRPSRYVGSKRKNIRKVSHSTSEEEDDEMEEEEYHTTPPPSKPTACTLTHSPPVHTDVNMTTPILSHKRRLSLSYLLDNDENIPQPQHIKSENDYSHIKSENYKLAPLVFNSTSPSPPTTLNSPYHHADSSTNLPPIQPHYLYVSKREHY